MHPTWEVVGTLVDSMGVDLPREIPEQNSVRTNVYGQDRRAYILMIEAVGPGNERIRNGPSRPKAR